MAPDQDFHLGEGGVETARNVFAAVIGDFVPPDRKPDEDHLVREFERYVGELPSLYQTGLVWILRAIEMAPLAMGHRRQFSNLPREDQVKVLEAFENSNNYVQRGVLLGIKTAVVVLFFSEPGMEEALGYDHRCLADVREARRESA